jgi:hypothetical protein
VPRRRGVQRHVRVFEGFCGHHLAYFAFDVHGLILTCTGGCCRLPAKTRVLTDATTKASACWPSACATSDSGGQAARYCSVHRATATSTTACASRFAHIAVADIKIVRMLTARTPTPAVNALVLLCGCQRQARCQRASASARMVGLVKTADK